MHHAGEPIRILIVDDEPAILRTLGGFLKLQGYDVTVTDDPGVALGLATGGSFHVIITDLVMPGMDGLELVRRLSSCDSLAQVVVMTAYSTLERTVEAHRIGVTDYLLKPFRNLTEVGEVVRQAEARHNRWRAAFAATIEQDGPP